MRFDIWGDEIAYDHQVVGRFTIGPTTLRENAEADLYGADPEGEEKRLAEALKANDQEWQAVVDDKDTEIKRLEDEIKRLEDENSSQMEALLAIDDGVTVEALQAELAEVQKAVTAWRNRCVEMHEAAKKPRKRRSAA